MEKNMPYFAILLVLLYALFNAFYKENEKVFVPKSQTYTAHTKTHKTEHYQEELEKLHTVSTLKAYIMRVINHGSDQFDFPAGEMEGGFAHPEDAAKIACFVIEFSGKKCEKPYEKDAAMLYTSNCGGCHGDDGKGRNGTFPDLTKETLLGIAKRETALKMIKNRRQHP
ncbi:MAG TPA: c-type cytochrome [Sulfurovum sp.]|nr:c-type cytochrome [Sulfurovum sp.]